MDRNNESELTIKKISDSFSLLNLPLISKYRVISFFGSTDGLPLTPLFNIQELIGRTLILKSFRFDYYVITGDFADIELIEGVTVTSEYLAPGVKILRLFEFDTGMEIDFRINDAPTGIFGNLAGGIGYPADLKLDNIFYKHPEKIQNISLRMTGGIINLPFRGNSVTVNAKVTIECYII